MRHLGKTHGLSITWLHEIANSGFCDMDYIESKSMAADIFTKFYPDRKREGRGSGGGRRGEAAGE